MPKKPKFKPVITRIKLNPEQAVLSCSCYIYGNQLQAITYYLSLGESFGICYSSRQALVGTVCNKDGFYVTGTSTPNIASS